MSEDKEVISDFKHFEKLLIENKIDYERKEVIVIKHVSSKLPNAELQEFFKTDRNVLQFGSLSVRSGAVDEIFLILDLSK